MMLVFIHFMYSLRAPADNSDSKQAEKTRSGRIRKKPGESSGIQEKVKR